MTILVLNRPQPAQQLISGKGARTLHVTVLTAACQVNFAHNRSTLENPPPFAAAGQGGTAITTAMGAIEMAWQGELWISGSSANASNPYMEIDI